MRIASWNLNHRVGKTRFRPEAADAAIALDADAIFLNEYFPREHGTAFARRLAESGWHHQLISTEPPERANRTFVASRIPVERDALALPTFDHQLPANVLAVCFPEAKLRVVALRVPAYESHQRELTLKSWDWLEGAAAALVGEAAVIVGDLNVSLRAPRARGGQHLLRLTQSGWLLATSESDPSYFSAQGRTSTIDHLLHTGSVEIGSILMVKSAGEFVLAGSPGALSDHAAIVADVRVEFARSA